MIWYFFKWFVVKICKFLVFGLFEDEFWWGIMCVLLMLLSVILVFMVLKSWIESLVVWRVGFCLVGLIFGIILYYIIIIMY